jgi:hypothetical protein
MKKAVIATFVATTLVCSALPAADAVNVYDASAAFEAIKSLEGDWVGARADGSGEVETSFKVTAAGSAVIKTYAPGKPHEMVTVYHMADDTLMLTHYCAVGNQPQMKFESSDRAGEIRFSFAGGTSFDPSKDTHAHEGWTRILADGRIETESIGYRDGKPAPPTRTVHERR